MKKCQLCGRPAEVFLTQVVNGEMTELCLCNRCAKDKGLFDPRTLSLAEKFYPENLKQKVDELVREIAMKAEGTLGYEIIDDEEVGMPFQSFKHSCCKRCGFSHEQLMSTQRVGCPECYTFFESGPGKALSDEVKEFDELEEVVDFPPLHRVAASVAKRRAFLQEQLKKAIRREDYEQAARLRDEINTLEDES